MVIDSSALIALLLGEAETDRFVEAIAAASIRLVSAGSYLETSIVMLSRIGQSAPGQVQRLLSELAVAVAPFTAKQAASAIDAYRLYGKGSGHPASLNFGDCFTYALAKTARLPVLFKGDDFGRTDIPVVFA